MKAADRDTLLMLVPLLARLLESPTEAAVVSFGHLFGESVRVRGRDAMSWWTGDGHVTLPKPVIDLLAEAALALREEIVEEIIHDNPDLHVEIGVSVFDSLDPKTQSSPWPTCSGTCPMRPCRPRSSSPGTRGLPGRCS